MSGRPVDTVTVVAGTPPRAALDLRYEVFVREQGVPPDLEHDGLDATADHAVVLAADGRAVATARLLDQGPRQSSVEPVGVIGRVAVAAAWRGRGLGRLVTAALEGRAGERGLPAVELHAQTRVADFYARQGYRPIGEPDVEAGIEHVWMRRELLPGLRRAQDSDAVALQDLIAGAWAQYPGCVLDVDAEEPWLRAPGTAHAATAGEPARALWVVPADRIGPAAMAGPAGGVLGSVAVWDRPAMGFPAAFERAEASERAGWAELKTLYVAAAARRRGMGTALVRRAEREARRWDARQMRLWTDTRFTDAHRLYRRLGYTATGRRRDLDDLSATIEIEFCRLLPPLNELPTAAGI
ncbi:GNAT family N-acetyltransferase [Frankia tisae]|uniref:GNAT family N-acetyltransferase n=1 Tax=Frankia tisae TaxID=2950104 RepID=UPI0021BFF597|nr:GNAT family N-acetyltransferase [Frankia tisae]